MIYKTGSLWKLWKCWHCSAWLGKAKGGGKGCAELLWQENMGSLMVISPSFHEIVDLGLQ